MGTSQGQTPRRDGCSSRQSGTWEPCCFHEKDLSAPAVDPPETGYRYVFGVSGQKKAAALPAGVAVVVFKGAQHIRHISRIQAGDQLGAFQMKLDV